MENGIFYTWLKCQIFRIIRFQITTKYQKLIDENLLIY